MSNEKEGKTIRINAGRPVAVFRSQHQFYEVAHDALGAIARWKSPIVRWRFYVAQIESEIEIIDYRVRVLEPASPVKQRQWQIGR